MYLETSSDILNIVLSVVIAAAGVAFIWLVVELIRIVRPVRKLVETVEDRLERIDAAVHLIKDKVFSVAGLLPAILDWIRGVTGGAPKRRKR